MASHNGPRSEGMVAIVTGLEDAGLSVTVRDVRGLDAAYRRSSARASTMRSLGQLGTVSSGVQTVSPPGRSRSTTEVIRPFVSTYQRAYGSRAGSQSPPTSLGRGTTTLDIQRLNEQLNELRTRIYANGPNAAPMNTNQRSAAPPSPPPVHSPSAPLNTRMTTPAPARPQRVHPVRDTPCYRSASNLDRARGPSSSHTRHDMRVSDAFVESLRKYPSSTDRSSSADIIQRLLAYTQSKHSSKKTRPKKVHSLTRHSREGTSSHMIRSSNKNVQTYTRTRNESPRVAVAESVYGQPERRRRVSPAKSDRSEGSPTGQDSTSYDYLKIASFTRNPDVRYLTDMPRYLRETLRFVCNNDEVPCPRMLERYSAHRQEHHSTEVSTLTVREMDEFAQTSGMPHKRSKRVCRFNDHPYTSSCRMQPRSMGESIRMKMSEIKEKLCVICNQPPPCICNNPPCPCPENRPIKFKERVKNINVCDEFRRLYTQEPISETCTCPQDVDETIEKTIDDWIKHIPIYANYTLKEKAMRDRVVRELKENIKKHLGDQVKCQDDALNCLKNLPMWFPPDADERERFKENLVKDLLDKTKKIDIFTERVRKWVQSLPFLSEAKIDKDKLVTEISKILKDTAMTTKDLKHDLKCDAYDILQRLPIKSCTCLETEQLADMIAHSLSSLPSEVIDGLKHSGEFSHVRKQVEFTDKIRRWVNKIPFEPDATIDREDITQELVDELIDIIRITDSASLWDAVKGYAQKKLHKMPVQGGFGEMAHQAAKLADQLTTDMFAEVVSNWAKTIAFDHDANIVPDIFAHDMTRQLTAIMKNLEPEEVEETLKKYIFDKLNAMPVSGSIPLKVAQAGRLANALSKLGRKDAGKIKETVKNWLNEVPFDADFDPPVDKSKVVNNLTHKINEKIETIRPEEIWSEIKKVTIDELTILPIKYSTNNVEPLARKLADSIVAFIFEDAVYGWARSVPFKQGAIELDSFAIDICKKLKDAVMYEEPEIFEKQVRTIALESLPDDLLTCGPEEKAKLIDDLVDTMNNTPNKRDKIAATVGNWYKTVPLINPVSREKVKDFVRKLKLKLTKTGPRELWDALKQSAIEEIEHSPTECLSTDIEVLAENLANMLAPEEFEEIVKEWVETISLDRKTNESVDALTRHLTKKLKEAISENHIIDVHDKLRNIIFDELNMTAVMLDEMKKAEDAERLINNLKKIYPDRDGILIIIENWIKTIPFKNEKSVNKIKITKELAKTFEEKIEAGKDSEDVWFVLSEIAQERLDNLPIDTTTYPTQRYAEHLANMILTHLLSHTIRNNINMSYFDPKFNVNIKELVNYLTKEVENIIMPRTREKYREMVKDIVVERLHNEPLMCTTTQIDEIAFEMANQIASLPSKPDQFSKTLRNWVKTVPFSSRSHVDKFKFATDLGKKLRHTIEKIPASEVRDVMISDTTESLKRTDLKCNDDEKSSLIENLIEQLIDSLYIDTIFDWLKTVPSKSETPVDRATLSKKIMDKLKPLLLSNNPDKKTLIKHVNDECMQVQLESDSSIEQNLINKLLKLPKNKPAKRQKFAVNISDWLKGVTLSLKPEDNEELIKETLDKLRDLRLQGKDEEIIRKEIKQDITNYVNKVFQDQKTDPEARKNLVNKMVKQVLSTLDVVVQERKQVLVPKFIESIREWWKEYQKLTKTDQKIKDELITELASKLGDDAVGGGKHALIKSKITKLISDTIDIIDSNLQDQPDTKNKLVKDLSDKIVADISLLSTHLTDKNILESQFRVEATHKVKSHISTVKKATHGVKSHISAVEKLLRSKSPTHTFSDLNTQEQSIPKREKTITTINLDESENVALQNKSTLIDELFKDIETKANINRLEATQKLNTVPSEDFRRTKDKSIENISKLSSSTLSQHKICTFMIHEKIAQNITNTLTRLLFQGYGIKRIENEIVDVIKAEIGNDFEIGTEALYKQVNKLIDKHIRTIKRIQSTDTEHKNEWHQKPSGLRLGILPEELGILPEEHKTTVDKSKADESIPDIRGKYDDSDKNSETRSLDRDVSTSYSSDEDPEKTLKNSLKSDMTTLFESVPELFSDNPADREEFENICNALATKLAKVSIQDLDKKQTRENLQKEIVEALEDILECKDEQLTMKTKLILANQLLDILAVYKGVLFYSSMTSKLIHEDEADIKHSINRWMQENSDLTISSSFERKVKVAKALAKSTKKMKEQNLARQNLKQKLLFEIKDKLDAALQYMGKQLNEETKQKYTDNLLEELLEIMTVSKSPRFCATYENQLLLKAFVEDLEEWVVSLPIIPGRTYMENILDYNKMIHRLSVTLKNLLFGLNTKYIKEEMASKIKDELDNLYGENIDEHEKNKLVGDLLDKLGKRLIQFEVNTSRRYLHDKNELTGDEYSLTLTGETPQKLKGKQDIFLKLEKAFKKDITEWMNDNLCIKSMAEIKQRVNNISGTLKNISESQEKRNDQQHISKDFTKRTENADLERINRINVTTIKSVKNVLPNGTEARKKTTYAINGSECTNVRNLTKNLAQLHSVNLDKEDLQSEMELEIKRNLDAASKGKDLNARLKDKLVEELLTKISEPSENYHDPTTSFRKIVISSQDTNDILTQLLPEIFFNKPSNDRELEKLGRNLTNLFNKLQTSDIENKSIRKKILTKIKDQLDTAFEHIENYLPLKGTHTITESLLDVVLDSVAKTDKKTDMLKVFQKEVLSWLEDIPETASTCTSERRANSKTSLVLAKKLVDIYNNGIDDEDLRMNFLEAIRIHLEDVLEKRGVIMQTKEINRLADKLLNSFTVLPEPLPKTTDTQESIIWEWVNGIPMLAHEYMSDKRKKVNELSKALQKIQRKCISSYIKNEEMRKEINRWLKDVSNKKNKKLDEYTKHNYITKLVENMQSHSSKRSKVKVKPGHLNDYGYTSESIELRKSVGRYDTTPSEVFYQVDDDTSSQTSAYEISSELDPDIKAKIFGLVTHNIDVMDVPEEAEIIKAQIMKILMVEAKLPEDEAKQLTKAILAYAKLQAQNDDDYEKRLLMVLRNEIRKIMADFSIDPNNNDEVEALLIDLELRRLFEGQSFEDANQENLKVLTEKGGLSHGDAVKMLSQLGGDYDKIMESMRAIEAGETSTPKKGKGGIKERGASGKAGLDAAKFKRDSDVVKYKSNLDNVIKNWLDNLPIDQNTLADEEYKDSVVQDLSGTLLDRQKYLQENPKKALSEDEEQENKKGLCNTWLEKFLEDNDLDIAKDNVDDLVTAITEISVPQLTDKSGQTGKAPITYQDALEDVILKWINELPPHLRPKISDDALRKLVEDLASKTEKYRGDPDAEEKIRAEIAKALPSLFKGVKGADLERLGSSLLNRLTNKGFTDNTWTQPDPMYHDALEDEIMSRIDALPPHLKPKLSDKSLRTYVKDLANKMEINKGDPDAEAKMQAEIAKALPSLFKGVEGADLERLESSLLNGLTNKGFTHNTWTQPDPTYHDALEDEIMSWIDALPPDLEPKLSDRSLRTYVKDLANKIEKHKGHPDAEAKMQADIAKALPSLFKGVKGADLERLGSSLLNRLTNKGFTDNIWTPPDPTYHGALEDEIMSRIDALPPHLKPKLSDKSLRTYVKDLASKMEKNKGDPDAEAKMQAEIAKALPSLFKGVEGADLERLESSLLNGLTNKGFTDNTWTQPDPTYHDALEDEIMSWIDALPPHLKPKLSDKSLRTYVKDLANKIEKHKGDPDAEAKMQTDIAKALPSLFKGVKGADLERLGSSLLNRLTNKGFTDNTWTPPDPTYHDALEDEIMSRIDALPPHLKPKLSDKSLRTYVKDLANKMEINKGDPDAEAKMQAEIAKALPSLFSGVEGADLEGLESSLLNGLTNKGFTDNTWTQPDPTYHDALEDEIMSWIDALPPHLKPKLSDKSLRTYVKDLANKIDKHNSDPDAEAKMQADIAKALPSLFKGVKGADLERLGSSLLNRLTNKGFTDNTWTPADPTYHDALEDEIMSRIDALPPHLKPKLSDKSLRTYVKDLANKMEINKSDPDAEAKMQAEIAKALPSLFSGVEGADLERLESSLLNGLTNKGFTDNTWTPPDPTYHDALEDEIMSRIDALPPHLKPKLSDKSLRTYVKDLANKMEINKSDPDAEAKMQAEIAKALPSLFKGVEGADLERLESSLLNGLTNKGLTDNTCTQPDPTYHDALEDEIISWIDALPPHLKPKLSDKSLRTCIKDLANKIEKHNSDPDAEAKMQADIAKALPSLFKGVKGADLDRLGSSLFSRLTNKGLTDNTWMPPDPTYHDALEDEIKSRIDALPPHLKPKLSDKSLRTYVKDLANKMEMNKGDPDAEAKMQAEIAKALPSLFKDVEGADLERLESSLLNGLTNKGFTENTWTPLDPTYHDALQDEIMSRIDALPPHLKPKLSDKSLRTYVKDLANKMEENKGDPDAEAKMQAEIAKALPSLFKDVEGADLERLESSLLNGLTNKGFTENTWTQPDPTYHDALEDEIISWIDALPPHLKPKLSDKSLRTYVKDLANKIEKHNGDPDAEAKMQAEIAKALPYLFKGVKGADLERLGSSLLNRLTNKGFTDNTCMSPDSTNHDALQDEIMSRIDALPPHLKPKLSGKSLRTYVKDLANKMEKYKGDPDAEAKMQAEIAKALPSLFKGVEGADLERLESSLLNGLTNKGFTENTWTQPDPTYQDALEDEIMSWIDALPPHFKPKLGDKSLRTCVKDLANKIEKHNSDPDAEAKMQADIAKALPSLFKGVKGADLERLGSSLLNRLTNKGFTDNTWTPPDPTYHDALEDEIMSRIDALPPYLKPKLSDKSLRTYVKDLANKMENNKGDPDAEAKMQAEIAKALPSLFKGVEGADLERLESSLLNGLTNKGFTENTWTQPDPTYHDALEDEIMSWIDTLPPHLKPKLSDKSLRTYVKDLANKIEKYNSDPDAEAKMQADIAKALPSLFKGVKGADLERLGSSLLNRLTNKGFTDNTWTPLDPTYHDALEDEIMSRIDALPPHLKPKLSDKSLRTYVKDLANKMENNKGDPDAEAKMQAEIAKALPSLFKGVEGADLERLESSLLNGLTNKGFTENTWTQPDPTYHDALEDEIMSWIDTLPPHLKPKLSDKSLRIYVKDLANKIEKYNSDPDAEAKMQADIAKALPSLFKGVKGADLERLGSSLLNRLTNKGFTDNTWTPPDPTYHDALEDEIMSRIDALPPHLKPKLSDKSLRTYVKDLANKMEKNKGDPDAEAKMQAEIAKALPSLFKGVEGADLERLESSLLNGLTNKGFTDDTWMPPLRQNSELAEQGLINTVQDWLKQIPMYQKASPEEKKQMELAAIEMAKGIKRAISVTKLTPGADMNELVREQILKDLKNLIKDPKLRNDEDFMNKTADSLQNYLKGQKIYQDVTGKPAELLPDILGLTVDEWLRKLPIEVKTRQEQERFDKGKEMFVSRLKQARSQFDPSSPEHNQAVKDEARKYLRANISDPKKKFDEKYIEDKVNELVKDLHSVPIETYYTTRNTIKPYRSPADTLYDYIENWIKDLPVEGEPEKVNLMKQNLASKLVNKIGELNLNPDVFNDADLYRDLLQDEIDKLLAKIPLNPELNKYLPALKKDLICKILDARLRMLEELAGKVYKQHLRDKISTSLPLPGCLTLDELASLELLKDKLADAFINLHYATCDENENKKYKSQISNELNKFINDVFHHSPCVQLDCDKLKDDLHTALTKVPVPRDDSMKSEVEQVRIRDLIYDWMRDIPLRQETATEKLHRYKLAAVLAKQIHDIEMEKQSNEFIDSEYKIGEEITRFLNKVPLRQGQNSAIPDLVHKLMHSLNYTEKSRQFISTSSRCQPNLNDTSADYCIQYPTTLSPEDQDLLRRIKLRRQTCRGVCPPITDTCSTCSQTDQRGHSDWIEQKSCPGVKRVSSPKYQNKDASCMTSKASPCHNPRVSVKEFLWESPDNSSQNTEQGIQTSPPVLESERPYICPLEQSAGYNSFAAPLGEPMNVNTDSCALNSVCPKTSISPHSVCPKTSISPHSIGPKTSISPHSICPRQSQYNQYLRPPKQYLEQPSMTDRLSQNPCHCPPSHYPEAQKRRPTVDDEEFSSEDEYISMPPGPSRYYRRPEYSSPEYLDKRPCHRRIMSWSTRFGDNMSNPCMRYRTRRDYFRPMMKDDTCNCKERVIISCKGHGNRYSDVCQACGNTCPHPRPMFFK